MRYYVVLYNAKKKSLEHCCTQLMLLGITEYRHQCVHNTEWHRIVEVLIVCTNQLHFYKNDNKINKQTL